ncbi:hypothetical protein [Streptomyces noursei]|uniref:hypothetical protein n=1 Tax=Streptomyces noursei TaxID=1971 RepID=UPI0005C85DE4|nr:hypothetical protein [Streptomyces noursei]
MGGDAGNAPTGGNSWETFTTKFNGHDLDGLKGMLDGANVQQVRDVAQNWQDLHDQLVGPGDGGGGIQKRFNDAVTKVMESWHGDTAEKFYKRAQEISQNFSSGAPYASHTAQVMGMAAQDLQKAVDKVKPIDDGWNWGDDVWGEMPWSDQIDDDDLNKVLNQGASTQGVLDANKDNLSGHQKKRLEAAVAMENLGTAYVVRASSLKPPTPGGKGFDDKIREPQDPTNGLGTMPMPMPGMGGSGGVGGGGGGGVKIPTRGMKAAPKMPETPKMPDQPGISGGLGQMKPNTPHVTTGLEGLQGGGPGGPGGLKIPTAGGPGGPGGGPGIHVPSGGGPSGGMPGMPGMPGGGRGMGALKSGPGGTKGVSGGPGGAKGTSGGPGAPGGARAGRPGMPGMGGAHAGGAGKGGGGRGGGVSAGGAQARQKGGIIGASGGKASAGGGAQGGSGLHRSRGGTGSGATNSSSGGRRPAGMMGGAHGAQGGKGEGKGQNGNRPDYLVEDEETWTPERNVAPRVIE